MALANYSTTVPVRNTVNEIMELLARGGATDVLARYDGAATIIGLAFKVSTKHGALPFEMPVNTKQVVAVLQKQYNEGRVPIAATRDGQAARVAWRILRDWIRMQFALIETQMVELEEVFLPYLRMGESTLYRHLEAGGFKALPSPE